MGQHKNRKLTEKQAKLVQILAENAKKHKAERLSRAKCYEMAGYSNANPDQAVAVEIRKPHIKLAILRLNPAFFEGDKTPEPEDEREWSRNNLRKFATTSAEAAAKYATFLQKEHELGAMDEVADRVLMSPMLDDDVLELLATDTPQDVVVATESGRGDSKGDEKSTENIDDSHDCEVT